MATKMPATRPSQGEQVTAAAVAAAKAAPSILPSRPISTTPERSANSPASAASTSGVATRMVESQQRPAMREQIVVHAGASAGCGGGTAPTICGLNMFSSAPQNRITRPWITTTISRVICGMSKDSSEPP